MDPNSSHANNFLTADASPPTIPAHRILYSPTTLPNSSPDGKGASIDYFGSGVSGEQHATEREKVFGDMDGDRNAAPAEGAGDNVMPLASSPAVEVEPYSPANAISLPSSSSDAPIPTSTSLLQPGRSTSIKRDSRASRPAQKSLAARTHSVKTAAITKSPIAQRHAAPASAPGSRSPGSSNKPMPGTSPLKIASSAAVAVPSFRRGTDATVSPLPKSKTASSGSAFDTPSPLLLTVAPSPLSETVGNPPSTMRHSSHRPPLLEHQGAGDSKMHNRPTILPVNGLSPNDIAPPYTLDPVVMSKNSISGSAEPNGLANSSVHLPNHHTVSQQSPQWGLDLRGEVSRAVMRELRQSQEHLLRACFIIERQCPAVSSDGIQ